MDAAAKLLMALPEVFSDLVDFALRKTGFKVMRGSLKERNTEAIAQLRKQKRWYKTVRNDVVEELEITNGTVTADMLVVLENQSSVSNVMAGRSLLTFAVRWDDWRRETKRDHVAKKELRTPQEVLDGVLPSDRMAPTFVLVVHFGQEAWTGPLKFTDSLDCPPELKPMLAECPSNVISFYNLSIEEINEMPPGALRAVAKSIHYANQPEKLFYEWETDPSFKPPRLDEMVDVIAIAVGMNNKLMKQQKEEDMPKTLSPMAQYLFKREEARVRAESKAEGIAEGTEKGRAEGIAEGTEKAIIKCIRNRRSRHMTPERILKDLQNDFDLDEAKARQYMEAGLAKA